MKILNLKQFLSLPPETLFMKYKPQVCELPAIFKGPFSDVDFVYQDLHSPYGSSDDVSKIFRDAVKNGTRFKLDYDATSRDGCFEDDQLFMVYDKEDVQQLIERLKKCL